MDRQTLLLTIGALTFSQALLGQFAIHGVPLFLRAEGHGSDVVGLVYIAAIPFTLRFVWAPLIDRYGSTRHGPFRLWILGGQTAALVALAAMGLSNPEASVGMLVAIMFLAMVALGTQQAATSGLMIRGLARADHARGAAAQAMGSTFAGMLLGAGVLYLLGDLGWTTVTGTLVALSLVMLVVVSTLPLDRGVAPPTERARLLSQFALFTAPRPRRLFALSLCVAAAVVVPYGLKSVILIDAGFSVAQSGLVGIVLGNLAGLLAVIAARPAVDRFGGHAVLGATGLLAAALSVGVAAALLSGPLTPALAAILTLGANALVFSGFTAIRSLVMPLCAPQRLATDFASFTSLEAVALLIVAGGASAFLDTIGLAPILLAGAAASMTGAIIALKRREPAMEPALPSTGGDLR